MSVWKSPDVQVVLSMHPSRVQEFAQWLKGSSAPDSRVRSYAEQIAAQGHGAHLAVIDPEDREQVERLDDLLWMTVDDDGQADMQAALREFAAPTKPRPAEPQNVGAVVTDRDGTRWTRVESATDTFSRNPWYPAAESDIQPREWDEIDAVTVLSEGVPT